LNFSPNTGRPAITPIFGRRGFATSAIARTRTEVELLAGVERLRLDAVELRRVLFLGVGARVVALDHELRPGDALELAHHVVHTLREAAQRQRHRLALRLVELDRHRRGEIAQDLLRARRQRVDPAFGQVGARRHDRNQVVHGDEDQREHDEADRRVDELFVFPEHQPAL
jgi:hypothetical protein